MATLAATAAPKLSEVSEGTKAQKTMNEIDKLLTQAKNFYQDKADTEGRGRFPGQDKFDKPVGDYTSITDVQNDIAANTGINSNGYSDLSKWRSVFGTSNADAYQGTQGYARLSKVFGDANAKGEWVDDANTTSCTHCTGGAGADEWLTLMGESAMASPFQDGHYVYVVVAGGQNGNEAAAPTLFIADVENPKDFNAVLEP
jgi:Tfp pilus assembly protein FimT